MLRTVKSAPATIYLPIDIQSETQHVHCCCSLPHGLALHFFRAALLHIIHVTGNYCIAVSRRVCTYGGLSNFRHLDLGWEIFPIAATPLFHLATAEKKHDYVVLAKRHREALLLGHLTPRVL